MKLHISPIPCGDEECNCCRGVYWGSPCPECGSTDTVNGFEQYHFMEMYYYEVDADPIIARCEKCGAAWRCEHPTGLLYSMDEWEWERVEPSTEASNT